MKISLSCVNKKHPDLPIIKKALESAEEFFIAKKKDSGIDCIMQLGIQVENNLFALFLAIKHFEKLNCPEEVVLLNELFREQKSSKQKKEVLLNLLKLHLSDNDERALPLAEEKLIIDEQDENR